MTAPGSYNANVVLTADVGQYQQSMAAAAAQTTQTGGVIDKLVGKVGNLRQSVTHKIEFYDKTSLASLAAMTTAAAVYQKQLSGLAASAAVTGTSMKQMKSGIESAFLKFPVARSELVALATEINQLGVRSPQEIGRLTATFTQLAAATGGSSQSLASSMLAFTQAMGDKSSGNVKAMSNSLVDLTKKLAISADGVLNFSQAIAPIAKVAGITENQVLGLSAAFTKAGADGYVAANTFNSMLQDITQLAATGSPDLAKYSQVLGMTVDQFNAMPRAEAVAKLFTTINAQGAQGINTLNQLGINGVRAITALQSVVSQGDLSQMAQGGSTTNGALQKGAKGAFNNLADSLAMTRNEITQYGTVVGTFFLTPMKEMVDVINSVVKYLGILTPLLKAPGALVGLVGATVSPLLSVAGPFLAMRWLRRSPLGTGFRYNFGAARRTDAEAAAAYRGSIGENTRFLAGEEAWRNSQLVRFGGTAGATLGSWVRRGLPEEASDMSFFWRGLGNRALSSPLRLIAGFANAQTNYLRHTMGGSFEMPVADRLAGAAFGGFRGGFQALLHPFQTYRSIQSAYGGFNSEGGMFGAQASALRGQVDKGILTEEAARKSLSATITAEIKRIQEKLVEEGKEISTSAELASALGAAAKAAATLAGVQTRAAGSALAGTIGALPLGKGLMGAGKFVGNLAKDFLGSPLGMVLTGSMLGMAGYHFYENQSKKDASYADFDQIQKYDQQLGIATTALSQFTTATNNATAAQSNNVPSDMGSATTASALAYDKASAPSKPVSGAIGALSKDHSVAAAISVVQSMGITQPGEMQKTIQDLYAAGYTTPQIQQIIAGYHAGGINTVGLGQNVNYAAIAHQVTGLEGLGSSLGFTPSRSKRGAELNTQMMGSIDNIRSADINLYGTDYANVDAYSRYVSLLGTELADLGQGMSSPNQIAGKRKRTQIYTRGGRAVSNGGVAIANQQQISSLEDELAREASQLTGKKDYGGFLSTLTHGKVSLGPNMTQDQIAQAFYQLMNSTQGGTEWLRKNLQDANGNWIVNPRNSKDFAAYLSSHGDLSQGSLANIMNQSGSVVGQNIMNNESVQRVAGGSQNPEDIAKAQQYILHSAIAMSKSLTDAVFEVDKFNAATGGAASPLNQLGEGLRQTLTAMAAGQLNLMSPAQQFNFGGISLQNAQNAPVDQDYQKNLSAAQDQMAQYVQQQQGMEKELYQTVINYNKQTSDAEADYYRQRGIMNRDFGIQLRQQTEDYQRQVFRSTRDFNIQLQRQAQTESQSIYDPFQRVTARYTIDAGTLVQNLQDQNIRIRTQLHQLQELRHMGVSQQAIDTLDLSNPNNSQQVGNLVDSLAQNPQLVAQINAAVQTRLRATTNLTQSQFSMTFRNATADFKRQMADGAQDFQIGTQRAIDAQGRALSDMATSFSITTRRSQRDFTDAMQTMLGSYTDIWNKLNGVVSGSLAKTAPGAEKMIESLYLQPLLKSPYFQYLMDYVSIYDKVSTTGATTASSFSPATPGSAKYNNNKPTANFGGVTGTNYKLVNGTFDTTGGVKQGKSNAEGGISVGPQMSLVSEWSANAAEMHVPLNRGEQYMTGLGNVVAKAVVQQMHATVYASPASSGTTVLDYSTNVTGNITVVAQDTKAFFAELQKRKRLDRLSHPALTSSPLNKS